MIEVHNLSFIYKINKGKSIFDFKKYFIKALNNLNFNVLQGERQAIIGFNGAGKSTFLKLLIGILVPSNGFIKVNGIDPVKDRIAHVRNIGVVWGQRSTLWTDIPVVDSYMALRKIYNIDLYAFKKRLNMLNEILDIESFWNQPVRKLSLGQRVKSEIVASLLHYPQILILDEPFLGLDFISRNAILSMLKIILERDEITLFLTSHNIDDIDFLCDRVAILNQGNLLVNEKIQKIRDEFEFNSQLIIEKTDTQPLTIMNKLIADNIKIHQESNKFKVEFNKKRVDFKILITELLKCNNTIVNVQFSDTSLESIISNILGGI